MTTMLERAARSAAAADATLHNGPDLYKINPDLYLRLTRAVLMTVREGSTEIFTAMEAAQPKWPSSQCDNARELAASSNDPKLRAAIDAILSEKQP